MEGHTAEEGAFFFLVFRQFEIPFDRRKVDGSAVAIEVVAGDGMAQGLHVYADLMGAAGMDLELHEREQAQFFDHFKIGEGGLAFLVDHHHPLFGGMLHDGEVDAAFFLRKRALDETLVDLFDGTFFKDLR